MQIHMAGPIIHVFWEFALKNMELCSFLISAISNKWMHQLAHVCNQAFCYYE